LPCSQPLGYPLGSFPPNMAAHARTLLLTLVPLLALTSSLLLPPVHASCTDELYSDFVLDFTDPAYLATLDDEDDAVWEASGIWSPPTPFISAFVPTNVVLTNSTSGGAGAFNSAFLFVNRGEYLDPSIPNRCPGGCAGQQYASGEIRTLLHDYCLGVYQSRARIAKRDGIINCPILVSADTGAPSYDLTYGASMEVEGHRTNFVRAKWFLDGKHHAQLLPAGVDLSERFHTYTVNVSETRITWTLDRFDLFFVDIPEKHQGEFEDMRMYINIWVCFTRTKLNDGAPCPAFVYDSDEPVPGFMPQTFNTSRAAAVMEIDWVYFNVAPALRASVVLALALAALCVAVV